MKIDSEFEERAEGFTLIELLVVIAVIAILASILLPALSSAKASALTIDCVNRKHQIALAWLMYATDNDECLVPNSLQPKSESSGRDFNNCWVNNWMRWNLDPRVTNRVLVTRPDLAPLTTYLSQNIQPYTCPADKFLSPEQRSAGWTARLRSVSMNEFLGEGAGSSSGDGYGSKSGGRFMIYRKLTDFREKSPSSIWVLGDEHPDTITSPMFKFIKTMDNLSEVKWTSLPASYHGGASVYNFGDGHAEKKKWLVSETKHPVQFQDLKGFSAGPDRRDFDWLLDHAAELR